MERSVLKSRWGPQQFRRRVGFRVCECYLVSRVVRLTELGVGRIVMRERRYLSRYVDYSFQRYGRLWD